MNHLDALESLAPFWAFIKLCWAFANSTSAFSRSFTGVIPTSWKCFAVSR